MEIPEAAYAAGHKADPYALSSDVIRAAAPLIVAAELRRLADKLDQLSTEWVRPVGVAADLRREADELDLSSVT